MKPGKTVYFFDNEGAPRKGKISLKKTNIIESIDGPKETVSFTIEGLKGEFKESDLIGSLASLLAKITDMLS